MDEQKKNVDRRAVSTACDGPSNDCPATLWGRLFRGVLCIGVFSLLTGLLWVGERSLYPKLYYWLVAMPIVLSIVVEPSALGRFIKSRDGILFLLFGGYMACSVLWATVDEPAFDLIKRPLFVLLLYVAVFELGRQRFDLLCGTVRWAAVFAIAAALYTLLRFYLEGGQGRLSGYGALFNPLLASHVYGFFVAFWLATLVVDDTTAKSLSPWGIMLLGAIILMTGSRTPLLASSAVVVWLAVIHSTRKSIGCVALLAGACLSVWLWAPDVLMQRGLSYRTEIWANVLQQIGNHLWFGHGFGTELSVQLDSVSYPFRDPHNITLSVIYCGGLIGGALWAALYAMALLSAWKWRGDKWVVVFSATVVYGLIAGMTEGGAFFSRPKEHWMLIWVPMALLAASTYRARSRPRPV